MNMAEAAHSAFPDMAQARSGDQLDNLLFHDGTVRYNKRLRVEHNLEKEYADCRTVYDLINTLSVNVRGVRVRPKIVPLEEDNGERFFVDFLNKIMVDIEAGKLPLARTVLEVERATLERGLALAVAAEAESRSLALASAAVEATPTPMPSSLVAATPAAPPVARAGADWPLELPALAGASEADAADRAGTACAPSAASAAGQPIPLRPRPLATPVSHVVAQETTPVAAATAGNDNPPVSRRRSRTVSTRHSANCEEGIETARRKRLSLSMAGMNWSRCSPSCARKIALRTAAALLRGL